MYDIVCSKNKTRGKNHVKSLSYFNQCKPHGDVIKSSQKLLY